MVKVLHVLALILSLVAIFVTLACFVVPCGAYAAPTDVQNVSKWKGEILKFSKFYLPALPPSVLAGQVHQESKGNPEAKSPVGAMGLLQIMPATARDIARTCNMPEFDAFNPRHAIKGGICYDAQLYALVGQRLPSWSGPIHERTDLMFRSYNGGAGWLLKEAAVWQRQGMPGGSAAWLAGVCRDAGRTEASCRENIEYPVRIKQHAVRWYLDWL